MSYRVIISLPYESDQSEEFASLDQVKNYIKTLQSGSYGWSLDNIEVIEIAASIDVYELMAD